MIGYARTGPHPVGDDVRLRRVADVESVAIADEFVLYRASTNTSWVCNRLAGLVWLSLDGEDTLGALWNDIAEEFGVDPEQVRSDFLPVLQTWTREGVVETSEEPWDPAQMVGDLFRGGAERWRRLPLPPNECGKAMPDRWPHRLTVEVDGTAVTVGADDPTVIAALRPWAVDLDPDFVDYGLILDPQPVPGYPARALPALHHGCEPVFRLNDTAVLRRAFGRVVASFARPAGAHEVRIALMPLVRDGRALLVPPAHAGAVSPHRYRQAGIEPVYTTSCVIDAATWTVRWDTALADDRDPAAPTGPLPIVDWWLPAADPEYLMSPGEALAHVMRLSVAVTADVTLPAAARLVADHPPRLAPLAPDRYTEALALKWADAMRAELLDAFVAGLDAA